MEQTYLKNTPIREALHAYLPVFGTHPATAVEQVLVTQAAGRITAEAVYARLNVPHYLACAMDGVAVLASSTFGASDLEPVSLSAGQYTVVDTGDPLPDGCDAVIMVEELIRRDDHILLMAPATPWQHIRQIGEDFSAGDMLLPSYSPLNPGALGTLVAGGILTVPVLRQPTVTLIPTGDEIVAPDSDLQPGQIAEFNSTLFGSLLKSWGAAVETTAIIPDRLDDLHLAVSVAAAHSDLVLVLAGSSAGRDDYTTRVIASLGDVFCHGLAIRPGKPAILGRVGSAPVIGLPGYPVSGLVVLEEIVAPLLRQMFRLDIPARPTVAAQLSRRLLSSLKYQEYIRVRLSRVNGRYAAIPLERGAGLVSSFLRADGWLIVPQDCEGYEAGDTVEILLLRPLAAINETISVIGSHDPLLDECADLLARETDPAVQLKSTHAGSFGGLLALRRGEAHLAGIHLLDEASGEYNLAAVAKNFPSGEVILVEGVYRQQGLMVAVGNPLQLSGLADLARPGVRYVNRQKGAGTRLLLDYQLRQLGLAPDQIAGYTREELTHTAVAAQIKSGSADAGLGILAAARIFGLDFISV
ncbi:MAG: molybdopterin biosynthesis protein, partial [Clostridia bacterium]|nr:molybdopterin biosynthesis protein [Clostridia bacterium]